MGIEEGWISVDELHHVWTVAIRDLEQKVYPEGSSPHRQSVISFFESIKYELFKRAKAEKSVLKRDDSRNYPERSDSQPHEERGSRSPEPPDLNREKWQERVKLGRMHAMEGLGRKDG